MTDKIIPFRGTYGTHKEIFGVDACFAQAQDRQAKAEEEREKMLNSNDTGYVSEAKEIDWAEVFTAKAGETKEESKQKIVDALTQQLEETINEHQEKQKAEADKRDFWRDYFGQDSKNDAQVKAMFPDYQKSRRRGGK